MNLTSKPAWNHPSIPQGCAKIKKTAPCQLKMKIMLMFFFFFYYLFTIHYDYVLTIELLTKCAFAKWVISENLCTKQPILWANNSWIVHHDVPSLLVLDYLIKHDMNQTQCDFFSFFLWLTLLRLLEAW